ncbi:hypothetical protein OGAPHI_003343 [Ogataea philodendri]|uniref:Uncharacterized protein n=1 Tax=Ogataea philodendri TaxID=1378263 RepID=A0A9P8P6V0_9ASCO|nr:uncharacterized protein OGAPHI_003343 [Ogataea philodendri]KAH3666893.1 hypothetical protein OGAPHI_003343 [Ogataea philodendri]
MYPIRKLGCFSTVPSFGTSSPVSSLIKVDFPAPLGPRTATLDERDSEHETFFNEGFSAVGYLNVTLDILATARVFDLTPVKIPGGGNAIFTFESVKVGDVGVLDQVIFQPFHVGHVQMVSRLVQQQNVGFHQHGSGQLQLHLPSSRQRAHLLCSSLLVESNLFQSVGDFLSRGVLQLWVGSNEVHKVHLGLFALQLVLNKTCSHLRLVWEPFQLAVGNGSHQSTLTNTVSSTETVSVALDESQVGLVQQQSGTVGKREVCIHNHHAVLG